MTSRRLVAVAAGWTMAVAAAMTFAATPPAVAGPGDDCPAGRVCIYVNSGWVGLITSKAGGEGLANVDAGQQDQTSSYWNKSGNARWYRDLNGGGTCFNMAANSHNEYAWTTPENDSLSSWATNCLCPH